MKKIEIRDKGLPYGSHVQKGLDLIGSISAQSSNDNTEVENKNDFYNPGPFVLNCIPKMRRVSTFWYH